MPTAKISSSLDQPQLDVLVDLGHPLLNRIFDGFVKVGAVGGAHAAVQDTVKLVNNSDTSKKSLQNLASRIGKETVQWGLVAGTFSGATYGIEEVRKSHDWKNALLGGLVTGAGLSLVESNPSSERVLRSAITGGALATAAEVLRNIT